jgi:hypothetical protein
MIPPTLPGQSDLAPVSVSIGYRAQHKGITGFLSTACELSRTCQRRPAPTQIPLYSTTYHFDYMYLYNIQKNIIHSRIMLELGTDSNTGSNFITRLKCPHHLRSSRSFRHPVRKLPLIF